LPKRGAKLVARYRLARRPVTAGLRFVAGRLLTRRLVTYRLVTHRLLTHPWGSVFELGPDRIIIIRRGH